MGGGGGDGEDGRRRHHAGCGGRARVAGPICEGGPQRLRQRRVLSRRFLWRIARHRPRARSQQRGEFVHGLQTARARAEPNHFLQQPKRALPDARGATDAVDVGRLGKARGDVAFALTPVGRVFVRQDERERGVAAVFVAAFGTGIYFANAS